MSVIVSMDNLYIAPCTPPPREEITHNFSIPAMPNKPNNEVSAGIFFSTHFVFTPTRIGMQVS